jgi:hypothetical protein
MVWMLLDESICSLDLEPLRPTVVLERVGRCHRDFRGSILRNGDTSREQRGGRRGRRGRAQGKEE